MLREKMLMCSRYYNSHILQLSSACYHTEMFYLAHKVQLRLMGSELKSLSNEGTGFYLD